VDSIEGKNVEFVKMSKLLIYQRDEELKKLGIKADNVLIFKVQKARQKIKSYDLSNFDNMTESDLDEIQSALDVMNRANYEYFKYYLITLKYSLKSYEGVSLNKLSEKNSLGVEIEINDIEQLLNTFTVEQIEDLGIRAENHSRLNDELKKN